MGEIIVLDTLEMRWQRLRASILRCQEQPTFANRLAVLIAEARYVEMTNASRRGGDAA